MDSGSQSNCFVEPSAACIENSIAHLKKTYSNEVISSDMSSSSQHQHLCSILAMDLNATTSLSDDSGIPPTNSSISSGDSYRLAFCRLDLNESDGEVSQYDSLDNCSDCGMSAEYFNTLKKGPIPPIDPPLEFQDSPKTTLLRSQALQTYAAQLTLDLIENVTTVAVPNDNSAGSDEDVKNAACNSHNSFLSPTSPKMHFNQIYASDSLLNRICVDNIYDDPNDLLCENQESLKSSKAVISCLLNSEADPKHLDEEDVVKPSSQQDSIRLRKFNFNRLSEIMDYDYYYRYKISNNCDTHQQKKAALLYSPLHHHHSSSLSTANRPNSRNSSRLSSSHNSLSVSNSNKADDSIFITQAMSHDTLLGKEISDFYNVPIDSDIYTFPIDMLRPEAGQQLAMKADMTIATTHIEKYRSRFKYVRNNKKRKRNSNTSEQIGVEKYSCKVKVSKPVSSSSGDKRHSVPENCLEPVSMTLEEVKRFYHTLYSSSDDAESTLNSNNAIARKNIDNSNANNNNVNENNEKNTQTTKILTSSAKVANIVACQKDKADKGGKQQLQHISGAKPNGTGKFSGTHGVKRPQFSINLNLRQKFCSIFRFRKNQRSSQGLPDCTEYDETHSNHSPRSVNDECGGGGCGGGGGREDKKKFFTRALPPLPNKTNTKSRKDDKKPDFNSAIHYAANIEKVKNYGWYWGPISSEAAEKILSNEPDGSFIVRDSSDDHYIFSLSFKLNNCVRHVRIEQDQGTFSFGSYAKFKSQTITEFIEKAVEHSRSGRYLFFLHRRPEHGPMRVQLTNPVSRFKHIQSLQHMCRFVILQAVVRRDLIATLPLPRRIIDYLSYKHCYSEQVESDSSQSQKVSGWRS